MNALVPLHFGTSDVRMVMIDGEPWWVLADVATALGLSDPTKIANRLEAYQKAALTIREGSSGQGRRTNLLNEAGVYAITLKSRKPEAKAFARWLFTEVLPAIRKFGMYPPPPIDTSLSNELYDGGKSTLGERFREERLRWEATSGYTLDVLSHFSKPIIGAIERDLGGLRGRGKRIEMLNYAGLDMLFVLTGHRSQTARERGIIDYIRSTDAEQLNAQALLEN